MYNLKIKSNTAAVWCITCIGLTRLHQKAANITSQGHLGWKNCGDSLETIGVSETNCPIDPKLWSVHFSHSFKGCCMLLKMGTFHVGCSR
jgi:hypothetical protein